MSITLVALVVLLEPSSAVLPFPVAYAPEARRPYDPKEPMWKGPTPCGKESPVTGAGGEASPPKRIDKMRLPFPAEKERRTWTWAPFLAEVSISTEGKVVAVRILRSNSEAFDSFVLRDLATQRYEAAREKGRPVEACMVYTSRPHL